MMMRHRPHAAALRLCVDNSSESDNDTRFFEHPCNSDRCQRPGISRRVLHLRIFQSDMPMDRSTSAIAGQRSAENISFLEGDNLAIRDTRDTSSPLSRPNHHLREKPALRCLGMTEKAALTVYRRAFKKRLKELRDRNNLTQLQVANSIRVTLDTYKKMEQRGSVKIEYVEPLALALAVSVSYLVTGREEEPRKVTPFRRSA